jgi:hypothetical protein
LDHYSHCGLEFSMMRYPRIAALLALVLLMIWLVPVGMAARQGDNVTDLPGVSIEMLARGAVAGPTDEELILLRATLAPHAYIPSGGAQKFTVLTVESGGVSLALLLGTAEVTRRSGAEQEPVAAGGLVRLDPGDAVAFDGETRLSIDNLGDVEATILLAVLGASGEPLFALHPAGSFSVETYACPAGMTSATLEPGECETSDQSLVQWSLRSDQFDAALGPEDAIIAGATTTWQGLPTGTYFVELTAEAFAPGYVDYFIPSSDQVTRQGERTTRIYYDAARSRGSIGAFVFTGGSTGS